MTIDRLFYGYMALIGAAAGALLIAVALFDLAAYLRARNAPGTMLAMNARLLGFVIGVVLMVAIPALAGTSVRFF